MEYEKRKSKRLANDVLKELRIMKQTYESCIGQAVRGYIQGIGSDPFFVLFYLQEQVESYIEACHNQKAIIHFDSTGSVMKGFPEQKRPYYYAVVLSGSSMPLLELSQHCTTCHGFWRDVTILCNGRWSVPKVAVVDFSFALINALMTLFNRSSVSLHAGHVEFSHGTRELHIFCDTHYCSLLRTFHQVGGKHVDSLGAAKVCATSSSGDGIDTPTVQVVIRGIVKIQSSTHHTDFREDDWRRCSSEAVVTDVRK